MIYRALDPQLLSAAEVNDFLHADVVEWLDAWASSVPYVVVASPRLKNLIILNAALSVKLGQPLATIDSGFHALKVQLEGDTPRRASCQFTFGLRTRN